MAALEEIFAAGRSRLAEDPSVATLADPDIPVWAKLVVVPTMAFWVLSFADAMALLRATAGSTDMDARLRQHAEEDAEHWRWFLADLEVLAARGIGPGGRDGVLAMHWGPETAPVRACAWTLHHLLRKHTDPVMRLAVLEACEHGFEAFMNSIRPVVQASGDYVTLRYLGEVHDAAEGEHALHEEADPFADVDWSCRDAAMLHRDVGAMYAALCGMHTCSDAAIRRAWRGGRD